MKGMTKMTPDFMEDFAIFLLELGALFALFGIYGFVADFILLHIKPIERYLDSMPDFEDDVEIARKYEKIRRTKAACRRKIIREAISSFFNKVLPLGNNCCQKGGMRQ